MESSLSDHKHTASVTLIQRRNERRTVASPFTWYERDREGWNTMEGECLQMRGTEKEEVKARFDKVKANTAAAKDG